MLTPLICSRSYDWDSRGDIYTSQYQQTKQYPVPDQYQDKYHPVESSQYRFQDTGKDTMSYPFQIQYQNINLSNKNILYGSKTSITYLFTNRLASLLTDKVIYRESLSLKLLVVECRALTMF